MALTQQQISQLLEVSQQRDNLLDELKTAGQQNDEMKSQISNVELVSNLDFKLLISAKVSIKWLDTFVALYVKLIFHGFVNDLFTAQHYNWQIIWAFNGEKLKNSV